MPTADSAGILVGRSFAIHCEHQLRVSHDITRIAIVVDEADPVAAPFEPHEVAGFRIGAILKHRKSLRGPQPTPARA